jgi:hypothetical protein
MDKPKYIVKLEIEAADEQEACDMAKDLTETTSAYFARAEIVSVYAKDEVLTGSCS